MPKLWYSNIAIYRYTNLTKGEDINIIYTNF